MPVAAITVATKHVKKEFKTDKPRRAAADPASRPSAISFPDGADDMPRRPSRWGRPLRRCTKDPG